MTIREQIHKVKEQSRKLSTSDDGQRRELLGLIAEGLVRDWPLIQSANEQDCQRAMKEGESQALLGRLSFTEDKRRSVLTGITQVSLLPDPKGRVLEKRLLDEGLTLSRVSVPLGVIGMIFEARPDALVQIVSLCVKSGNAIILKGGAEALLTNRALVSSIARSAGASSLGNGWLLLLESHEDVEEMLSCRSDIDLVIPRGSNKFVQYVMDHTSIPVLGHSSGICHLYVDKDANLDMAVNCAFDAKTQYPAACNAIETILVHSSVAASFLPLLQKKFNEKKVVIHGDERVCSFIRCLPYKEGDWGKEYLALECNVHIVDSYQMAVDHIATYGSHHTDAIITDNDATAKAFLMDVDSADVFVNCSTRFADGYRFGLGAEVGISTSKIHARGPVGLSGLMSSKWLLYGKGNVVSSYVGDHAKTFIHKDLL
ncbi:MAG: glutamate-5-semialdehyde dehydrogenase [Sphaerochaetaceae bacterium]